jgi:type 2 lantibiotic biosynthesis protein LanM
MKTAVAVSATDLAVIAARASGWQERRGVFPGEEALEDQSLIDARLARWRHLVANDEPGRFATYLAWHGLDERTARTAVAPRREGAETRLPPWTAVLRECMEEAAEPGPSFEADAVDLDRPLPFEEFLAPFARVAWRRVVRQADAACALLLPAARKTLIESLLEDLSRLCWPTLQVEFSMFRNLYQSPLDQFFPAADSAPSRELYETFLHRLLGSGLAAFFREYAVLGRVLATRVAAWASATAEFLERLAADRPQIQSAFGKGMDPGRVTAIEPALSDPHCGGRVVHVLQFASGLRLVYKPKDSALESAYWRLLDWLNRHGAPLPLKVLQILARPGYCWVEFADYLPCASAAEAQRYYQRAGMLLALLHGLHGTDVHFENIIACGEHPVLIDVEMLLQSRPRPSDAPEGQAGEPAGPRPTLTPFDSSVLRTGLLPSWEVDLDGEVYDCSGLVQVEPGDQGTGEDPWQDVNTDAMVLGELKELPSAPRNGPRLEDTPLSPNDYVEQIVSGFTAMNRFLVERRDDLLAPHGPFAAFAHLPVRFIYRPTQQYFVLLEKTRHPRFMREGVDRAMEFEILCRQLTFFPERPSHLAVLQDEMAAMERLDVPYYTVDSSDIALRMESGQVLKRFFEETGHDRAASRLRAFSEEDCRFQVALIRGSFHARQARAASAAPRGQGTVCPLPGDDAPPWRNPEAGKACSREEMVAQSLHIAAELKERAICSREGASWIGLEFLFDANKYRLQPTDFGLYNGSAGVGLFLAALTKVTGSTEYRELALAALQPLRRLSRTRPAAPVLQTMGVGTAAGLGAVVYALVRTADFLNEPALREDAMRIAGWLSDDVIRADKAFDVLSGSAGAILALLALHRSVEEGQLLERASACGRHLLAHRVTVAGGHRAWKPLKGALPLTGFSHGAAGIAYALASLALATGNEGFLDAAREGVRYERSLFDVGQGNWPDLRESTESGQGTTFRTSWCHGAPGIVLARLGGLPILDDAAVRDEIERGLVTTEQTRPEEVDHLCCGNLSRIDVLLEASRRLDRPALAEAANRQAARVLRNAQATGSFQLFSNLPRGVYNPGLFQGTAGIGYELLRLATPEALPCILLLE